MTFSALKRPPKQAALGAAVWQTVRLDQSDSSHLLVLFNRRPFDCLNCRSQRDSTVESLKRHFLVSAQQQGVHMIARLLLLCLAMLFGTLLFGLAPLAVTLSPFRVTAVSTFGSGLLVGAALGVILPEGIEAVYAASKDDQSRTISFALSIGFAVMFIIDHLLNKDGEPHAQERSSHVHHEAEAQENHYYLSDESAASPRSSMGDAERSRGELDSPKSPTPLIKRRRVSTGGEAAARAHSLSTVVGLLVHSLADGVSLGSSTAASTAGNHLDLVIFAAILIHKAPAAFGLTTVLLSDGAPRAFVRRAVLLFALAAPVGALITFALLRLIGSEAVRLQHATGVALVVSAGTFLYVSTHIVADQGHATEKLSKNAHGFVVLLGLACPLALNLLSGHEHSAS